MSGAARRWLLERVAIRDLLGFQGERAFDFEDGLQVLEAPNHTGKTSLALALLWGLTGVVPNLKRFDLRSFRLANKHAGENADPRVEIVLRDGEGARLTIRRRYSTKRKEVRETPEVLLGEEEARGAEADRRILEELGLAADSLEGCGVVLQDHRLKLITGKETEISSVVNDMLGLETLSEVVPRLEELRKETDALKREVDRYLEGADPVRRWEEELRRLEQVHERRENEALEAGYPPEALEDLEALLDGELAEVAEALERKPPRRGVAAEDGVKRLRRALAEKRKQSPASKERLRIEKDRRARERAAKDLRGLVRRWRSHDAALAEDRSKGETDEEALGHTLARAEETLAENERRREAIGAEEALLKAAYAHLLQHAEAPACPVCRQAVEAGALRAEIRERLDARLAAELETLEASDAGARSARERAAARLEEVRALRRAHAEIVAETEDLLAGLAEAGLEAEVPVEAEGLFREGEARAALQTALDGAADEREREAADRKDREREIQEALARQEEEVHEPLDARLNRVMERLAPLRAARAEVEAHGTKRESARERAGALQTLAEESKDFALQLRRIARAVSQEQEGRAARAVQARLPFVSRFFRDVAGNPDYTGLAVETALSGSKIVYRLRATSSKVAALDDAVGHVLSEGDLSAAGMALLLGLATGESHRLGFLLLDDPAQGMDPTLQRNFAREVAALEDRPQVVILTHQPEFAAALAEHGASRTRMGRWEGGRHHDE